MFKALSTLSPRLRFNYSKPNIENFVFKLHYKFTVVMLLAFVILVCGREYFGDHIKCISDKGVEDKVIQTYCFFMGTFTMARHYNETLLRAGALPHPGIGPMAKDDELLHHTYYQWVPFVLFIQAICFYMPHYIWKKKEGGRVKVLVDGLQYASLASQSEDLKIGNTNIPSKDNLEKKIDIIRKDILQRLRITRTWSTWLIAMEVINFLQVIFQVWLVDVFLNGNFISLGAKVLNIGTWDYIADPLEKFFPKVTKCTFKKYGPSGTIQKHDALCVMALNIIHEKIYTILWFWFLFLFVVSLLALVWRFIAYHFYSRSLKFNEVVFHRISSSKLNQYDIVRVINSCKFGDWLFLYYLAKNMKSVVFQQLFSGLAAELEKREFPYERMGQKGKIAQPLLGQTSYKEETLPYKSHT